MNEREAHLRRMVDAHTHTSHDRIRHSLTFPLMTSARVKTFQIYVLNSTNEGIFQCFKSLNIHV